MCLLLRPGRGAEYSDQPICLCVCLSVCTFVCLSASISLEPLEWSERNFVCGSPVAVARSTSGGVALHYVLPVLWMTSRLVVMGSTPKGGGWHVPRLAWTAWQYRGRVWCLWYESLLLLVLWVPRKLLVSYVLTGNLRTVKLPATNVTGNLRTLTPAKLSAISWQ